MLTRRFFVLLKAPGLPNGLGAFASRRPVALPFSEKRIVGFYDPTGEWHETTEIRNPLRATTPHRLTRIINDTYDAPRSQDEKECPDDRILTKFGIGACGW